MPRKNSSHSTCLPTLVVIRVFISHSGECVVEPLCGFWDNFSKCTLSLEEPLRALNRGLLALLWVVLCTSQVRYLWSGENHFNALLIVLWVCMLPEGADCSLPRGGSLVKRNISMSFANLEKRPQRPQAKSYITMTSMGNLAASS